MLEPSNNNELPAIPAKRYFTIGEVSDLCGVKPHVLRYWEQEFPQLKPVKRRGNRRYYQRQDVIMIRQIREPALRRGLHDRRRAQSPRRRRGARGQHARASRSIRQVRAELEELLRHAAPLTPATVRSAIIRRPVGAWRSLVAHLHGVQGVARFKSSSLRPINPDSLP